MFDNHTQASTSRKGQTDLINVVKESHAELSIDTKEEPYNVDLQESNLSQEQTEALLSLLQDFKDVFTSPTTPLGKTPTV